MAILNFNLVVPAADGGGAAVDVSGIGALKTITAAGTYQAMVHIQVSMEAVPTQWVTIHSFPPGGGKVTMEVVARNMRVLVAGYLSGAGNVDVSGWDVGSEYQALAVPAGDGVGGSSAVPNLDAFRSFWVGGAFGGVLSVEASDDNVDFVPCTDDFTAPGVQNVVNVAGFLRVRRRGGASGAPLVIIGAAAAGGGAGDVCGFVATSVPFADAAGCLTDDGINFAYTLASQRLLVRNLDISPVGVTGGTATAPLRFTSAGYLDQANAEVHNVLFNLSATVNFVGGGGAIAAEVAYRIQPPTYTADAAQTITVAATLGVDGAPIAGAGATLTERYAVWTGRDGSGQARFDINGIGAVATDAARGILLANHSDAAAGAQQFSPMFVLEAQGWKTDAVAATIECQYGLQVHSVEGAALPTAELRFFVNINEGGFTELMRLDSSTGADQTPMWLFQGSVAGMRRVTMGADNGLPGVGFRGLRMDTA